MSYRQSGYVSHYLNHDNFENERGSWVLITKSEPQTCSGALLGKPGHSVTLVTLVRGDQSCTYFLKWYIVEHESLLTDPFIKGIVVYVFYSNYVENDNNPQLYVSISKKKNRHWRKYSQTIINLILLRCIWML